MHSTSQCCILKLEQCFVRWQWASSWPFIVEIIALCFPDSDNWASPCFLSACSGWILNQLSSITVIAPLLSSLEPRLHHANSERWGHLSWRKSASVTGLHWLQRKCCWGWAVHSSCGLQTSSCCFRLLNGFSWAIGSHLLKQGRARPMLPYSYESHSNCPSTLRKCYDPFVGY